VLVAVNNTPIVASAGRAYAAYSWPYDSLPVSFYQQQVSKYTYVIIITTVGGVDLIVVMVCILM